MDRAKQVMLGQRAKQVIHVQRARHVMHKQRANRSYMYRGNDGNPAIDIDRR